MSDNAALKQTKGILTPTERYEDRNEASRQEAEARQSQMWTAMPVIIKKHDRDKNTVHATPSVKLNHLKEDGTAEWLQIETMQDLPVLYYGGGGATVTVPMKDGDEALAVVASRSIDKWWNEGGVQEQLHGRMHDISDSFILPGFRSQKRKLKNVSEKTWQLRNEDGKSYVEFDPGDTPSYTINIKGKVAIQSADGAVTATAKGDFTAQSDARATVKAPRVVLDGQTTVTNRLTAGHTTVASLKTGGAATPARGDLPGDINGERLLVNGVPIDTSEVIIGGDGAPTADDGVIGDYYLDTASDTLYGPKQDAGETWPVALVGFPEAPIDGVAYARKDAAWVPESVGGPGGSTDWNEITNKPATFPPTLPIAQSGVTNLVSDLAAKEPTIAAGTAAQYWRGTKVWATLDKAAVGLANVDNTSDAAKPISTATANALSGKEPTIAVGTAAQYWRGDKAWAAHDKASVGLANVDNTSDAAKPISTATQNALNAKESTANKGVANGYASLDASAKVPAAQLPSYVDDVQEFANLAAFPATGATGVIYVALDTNRTYRWSGSAYVEISPSPGSTDSLPEGSVNLYHTTARAAAAAPVQSVATRTGAVVLTKTDVGLSNVDNTSDAAKPVSSDTQTALNLKANLASPTFSGTPSLPTGTIGVTQAVADSSTALATTAFVKAQPYLSGTVPIASGGTGATSLPLVSGPTGHAAVVGNFLSTNGSAVATVGDVNSAIGYGGSGESLQIHSSGTSTSTVVPIINAVRTRGSFSGPTQVLTSDRLLGIQANGWGATAINAAPRAVMSAFAAEAWSDTAQGAYWNWQTTPTGTTTTAVKMTLSGGGDLSVTGAVSAASVSATTPIAISSGGTNATSLPRVAGPTGYGAVIGNFLASNGTLVSTVGDADSAIGYGGGGESLQIMVSSATAGTAPTINTNRSRGTFSGPTAVLANDLLFSIYVGGWGTTGVNSGARASLRAYASENWTDTAQGTQWQWHTALNGTLTSAANMTLTGAGALTVTGALSAASASLTGNLVLNGVNAHTNDALNAGFNKLYDNSGAISLWLGNAAAQPYNLHRATAHIFQSRAGVEYARADAAGITVTGRVAISGPNELNLNGVTLAVNDAPGAGFNKLYDNSGAISLYLGNATTLSANYHRQTAHFFESRAAVRYVTIDATGVSINGNSAIYGPSATVTLADTLPVAAGNGGRLQLSGNNAGGALFTHGEIRGYTAGGIPGGEHAYLQFLTMRSGTLTVAGYFDHLGNLYVATSGYKPGGGVWADSSDKRLKRNIKQYCAGLAEITRLCPVTYQFNGLADTPDDGRVFTGLVADEAREAMPELVGTRRGRLHKDDEDETDILTVDATPVLFALINSCKELQAQNAALEERLARLEARLNETH